MILCGAIEDGFSFIFVCSFVNSFEWTKNFYPVFSVRYSMGKRKAYKTCLFILLWIFFLFFTNSTSSSYFWGSSYFEIIIISLFSKCNHKYGVSMWHLCLTYFLIPVPMFVFVFVLIFRVRMKCDTDIYHCVNHLRKAIVTLGAHNVQIHFQIANGKKLFNEIVQTLMECIVFRNEK